MGRPKKGEFFTKSINIPMELKKKLENQAKSENRDLNNMIITILLNYYNSDNK